MLSDYHTPVAPSSIGNTALLNYSEPVIDCDTGITHIVKVTDASGCVSQSNIATRQFTYLGNIVDAPSLRCVNVLPSGQIDLTWNTSNITSFTNFNGYEIYKNSGAGFNLLTTINASGTTTFNDAAANGNTQSYSYYLLSRSGCSGNEPSPANSATLSSIFLTTTNTNTNLDPANADLSWTALSSPLPGTTSGLYDIFSDYHNPAAPVGIATSALLNYTEPITDCDTGITHMIQVADASGCISQSNIVTRQFTYLGKIVAAPDLHCVSVLPSGQVELTWDIANIPSFTNFNSYEIYSNSGAGFNLLSTINTSGTTTFTDATANGNNQAYSYYMLSRSGCTGTEPSPTNTATLSSIFLTTANTNINNDPANADLTWTALSTPLPGSTSGQYDIFSDYHNPASPVGIGSTAALNYTEPVINCDTGITHVVKVADALGCTSQSNIVTRQFTYLGNVVEAPQIRCVSVVQPAGGIQVTWVTNTITDFTNFNSYELYRDNALVTTINNQATLTYLDGGTNGNTASHNYYILSKSGCTGTVPSLANSDTMNSIYLTVNVAPGGVQGTLNWNPVHNPALPGGSNTFDIYKRHSGGVDQLVASGVTALTLIDSNNVCGEFIGYRVDQFDAVGNCISSSNYPNGWFEDQSPPADPILISASVNPNDDQTVTLQWLASPNPDVDHYQIYVKNNFNAWDSIGTTAVGVNTFSTTNPAVDFATQYYDVIAVDSCGNKSTGLGSIVHGTIHSTALMDICSGAIDIAWNPYLNMPGGINHYNVYISENGGAPGPPVQVSSNLTYYSDTNLVAGSIYCYYVTAAGNTLGYEALSNASCDTAELLTLPQFSYLNKASVIDHRRVIVEAIVDTADNVDISRFKMQRAINRTGPFYTIGVIMYTGSPKISFLDNTAQTDETSYYYRMITLDSCGNEVLVTNVGRTILLTGNPQYNLTNRLTWNDYEEWLGGVNRYSLFRKVDDIWATAPIFNPLAGINEYLDNVGDIYQTTGRFCYRIAAYEGAGNPYGFADTSYSNEFCLIQEPHLFVPSAFTPDGKNPVFKPEFIYVDAQNYNFSIYNRWGQKIFETENPQDGWNGTIDGDKAPEGTYVYSVRMFGTNGQELNKSGRVSLLR